MTGNQWNAFLVPWKVEHDSTKLDLLAKFVDDYILDYSIV